jgi:hypothetical protein
VLANNPGGVEQKRVMIARIHQKQKKLVMIREDFLQTNVIETKGFSDFATPRGREKKGTTIEPKCTVSY